MEILNNHVRVIVNDDSNRSCGSAHSLWEKFVGAVARETVFANFDKL